MFGDLIMDSQEDDRVNPCTHKYDIGYSNGFFSYYDTTGAPTPSLDNPHYLLSDLNNEQINSMFEQDDCLAFYNPAIRSKQRYTKPSRKDPVFKKHYKTNPELSFANGMKSKEPICKRTPSGDGILNSFVKSRKKRKTYSAFVHC